MARSLVDEAGPLAADFARCDVGLVIIDSKMFAVAGGDGAAFHEPITAFYGALRLFSPAVSPVLPEDNTRRTLNRGTKPGGFVPVPDSKPKQWARRSARE